MDRREFLEKMALYSAGLLATAPVFRIIPAAIAEETKPLLVVGKNSDYIKLVEKSIEALGGMSAFMKKGDKVVVKPNIGWDRSPEQAANTHPQVVKTLVKLALDEGASKVQVFDRTCNNERRCYTNSGIKAAVDSIGDKKAVCEYIDSRKFVKVDIEKGKSLKTWRLYKDAMAADCYINVPIAKDHGLMKLSLGLKNVMGVMGGVRGRIHDDLGQSLADLSTVISPELTVIDATRILLRNGPQGGKLEDVKVLHTLVASADMVAADAYGTTLFDMEPNQIGSTVAAYKMGLGEMDVSKMNVVKV